MKRLVVLFVALFASISALSAQNYMVVDSEQIFMSMPQYTEALSELESLAEGYQKKVDEQFAQIETLYNNYVVQRNSLTAADRTSRESEILRKEEAANEYQESIFSTEGVLMQRRIELISPIQKRVFAAIESYAKANGFDIVLDLASNATILYYNSSVDRTDAVIQALK